MKTRSAITISIMGILVLFALVVVSDAKADHLPEPIVCLDPGHGGSDPGAINTTVNPDLIESEINLDVSFGLKHLLEEAGYSVVLTRETNDPSQSWSNKDRYTFCNNQHATILVSVHTNSVTDITWDGSLTLYGPGKSPDLALAIQDALMNELSNQLPAGVAAFTDYGIDVFASGVLFKSDMPSAMAEPLFMSNPFEAEALATHIFTGNPADGIFNPACGNLMGDSPCRRGQIAQGIFAGIVSYLPIESPPDVLITSPADGASFNSGELILFTGSAFDAEDGEITGDIVWISDLDGEIGTGGSFNALLSDDTHLITAEVADSAGQLSTDSITITVGDASGPINLSVNAYKVKGTNYADLTWDGLTSANVYIFRDGGLLATTANDGAFTDDSLGKGPDQVVYQVCEAGSGTCSQEIMANW